ncbi:hypothetical protein HPP92_007084 [Vanilla planifolia]|uniref:Uncharacterized protein n=1 Tax=Vanilla planifolia TaxID=51239 RepID=A0A835V8C8_VANPL|nr:hypothetical protein HPP92_007084 [Vanilla planifolia]
MHRALGPVKASASRRLRITRSCPSTGLLRPTRGPAAGISQCLRPAVCKWTALL